jgi:hypothetical protein
VLEEFKGFGLESCGNGFWGQRCVNCGGIVDLVIAAHQCVTLQAEKGSFLPHGQIEQLITTRF